MADAPLTDLIDAYAEARHVHGDHTYNPTTKAARDAVFAALTQAADAGAAEPVSIADVRRKFEEWYEAHQMPAEAGWFVRDKDDPEDYAFSPTQDAWEGFAGAMSLGVDWWGRKVAAQQIQQAVARALAPIQQAIRDYHYALDTRQHGGSASYRAVDAISDALGMCWKQGEEAAIRQQGTP